MNILTLANTPGEITRKGAEHERDSVIDLAWYNEAAIQSATFSELKTDWEGNLGSDHAMLHITGHMREAANIGNREDNMGFLIDPEQREEWICAYNERVSLHAYSLTPTPAEVERAAALLTDDIQQTNGDIFRKRRPAHLKASPWWNAACAIATQNLCDARDTESREVAHARLKGTVRAAKRRWADKYIEKAQIWEVAAWRHGRRLSKVPALQGPEGLAHSHEEMADIFSQRFFPQSPPRGRDTLRG